MKTLAVAVLILLYARATAAQDAPAAPGPDERIAHARQVYTQRGPAAALPEFEQALAIFRESRDRLREGITLGYMGNCYRRLGDLPRALDFVQQAMTIKEDLGNRLEIGKSHNQFGLIYWDMAEYVKAIAHFQQAIVIGHELNEYELAGQAHNNLGLVYDEMGDYPHSQEQYQRALEIHRAAHNERGEGDTLANIGGVHLLVGEYREALDYYQQALAIHERLGLMPTASIELGNSGICYTAVGESEKALATFDKALDLAHKAGIQKEQADWHKGKGEAFLHLGEFGHAIEEYRLAQQTYESAGLKRELVEALNDSGNLHLMLGDAGFAEQDFRRALHLAQTIGNDRGVTINLIALGELESQRKRYPQAEIFYQDALTRARKAGDQERIAGSLIELALDQRELGKLAAAETEAQQAVQAARKAAIPPTEARSYYALGEVQRASRHFDDALQHYAAASAIEEAVRDPDLDWRIAYGRGQALEKLDREQEALASYKQAVAIIEGVRSQLAEDRFRAGYLENKYQVYVALVELLLKLQQPGEAFSYSEGLRAHSFLEQMNRGTPSPLDSTQHHAEEELRARIRQLRKAIQTEWSQPTSQRRGQAIDTFSRDLAAAERAYQDLLDDLRRSDPSYAMLLTLSVPSVTELQQVLPADTALVEYVMAENNLATFVLSSDHIWAKTTSVSTDSLQARVELFRDLIVRPNSDSWRAPAAALRKILISPLEQEGWLKGIRKLYLVPNGVLNYVPFAALVRNSPSGTQFLVDDYVLAYLPAAGVLTLHRNDVVPDGKLLAVAPERAHLRYAEEEVKDVSRFFSSGRLVLTGTSATKDAFEQKAGSYQFLHLATHGFLNKEAPLLSQLELEPSANDEGFLEVHEILGLRLNARLVTLSACETALGSGYFSEVPAGDDFVGFTRAFLTAGSQAVMASLWEVNDRSTLHLMVDFYRRLPDGNNAGALAAAQRRMNARRGPYSHPYFWAPFVLVGTMN